MPNIWYDVSAVTDVRPLITLFSREDRRRILYGSDGVDATYFHGQYAAMGRAWQYVDVSRFNLQFPHCDGRPILAIYEQLLSMKHAAEIAQWSADDIQNLFWRNAVAAFGVRFGDDAAHDAVGTVSRLRPPTPARSNSFPAERNCSASGPRCSLPDSGPPMRAKLMVVK